MQIMMIQKIDKRYTSLPLQKNLTQFFLELNQRGIRVSHFITVESVAEYLEYENFMTHQKTVDNVTESTVALFLDFYGEDLRQLTMRENALNDNRLFFSASDLKQQEEVILTTIQNQFKRRDGMVFSRVVKLCGIKNNELQKGIQLLLEQEKIVTYSVDCLEVKKQPSICLGTLTEAQFGEVLDVTLYFQETMIKDKEEGDSRASLLALFPEKVYATEREVTLEAVLIEQLKAKGLTLSAAESCTGGLFMAQMINVSGASSVINRSFITYANEAKEECLCVSTKTLERFGAVSKETAREMAIGAAKVAKSDVAISITGIAGPLGGTKEKPVGTVYLGCYYKGDTQVILLSGNGTREEIRNQTVQMAKNLLYQVLK